MNGSVIHPVLVAEDDAKIAHVIRVYLEKNHRR
jgi:hypothetical protein